MKKRIVLVTILYFILPLFLQNGIFSVAAQTVSITPHEVFVGDVAEVRYDFICSWTLCTETNPIELEGSKFFLNAWPTGSETAVLAQKMFEILSARIIINPNNNETKPLSDKYILILKIIPWVTGKLDIPPFNIVNAFGIAKKTSEINENKVESLSLIVDIPPVKISSIVDKTQKKILQPCAGPVVIPGTTWIVYLAVILIVILLLVFIFFIVRFKQVQNCVLSILHRMFLSKNYRLTLKQLSALEKKSTTMDVRFFASGVSDAIRNYLRCRFNYNFMAVETSKLYTIFNVITGETASRSAQNAIEELQSVFMRLDYIKFSGEIDIVDKNATSNIIKRVYGAIAYLEKTEDDEDEF
jgi:hypothetical protein